MSKPRILVTGFNKNQCTRKFYLRQQLKVIPSHYSLWNCLTEMGYEVDQRQVELGEDLSGYDEVIVFIAGPRQLVATTVFEGLWAISQHPRCILAFDDWQVPDLFKGVAKCDGKRDELFAQFILDVNKKTLEQVEPYESQFMAALSIITAMKNRMLISAFRTEHVGDDENYGPHLLFDKINYPRDRLFVYNPNPCHRNRKWNDVGHEGPEDPTWKASPLAMSAQPLPDKERRFNFASLVQSKTQKWLKKQGYTGNPKNDEEGFIYGTGGFGSSMRLENDKGAPPTFEAWPVDLYGSKADTQKRLTEDDMVQVITRDWGCLMPGYDHAGSGWWRARPLQCADACSILLGEDKELCVYYGNDYPYFGLKAADLVNCTEEELLEIADTQCRLLYKIHPLSREVQQIELRAVLDADK
jgi:hypothetical protein